MIKILTKIRGKITIIVVENRESYYFIIIYKCKEVPLSLFSYQMLASTFDFDEWSSYYKVCRYTAPNSDLSSLKTGFNALVRILLRPNAIIL